MKLIKYLRLTTLFIVIFASLANRAMAQTDTTKVPKPDSVSQQSVKEEEKKKKKKDEIIVYGGVNASSLSSSTQYETTADLGYQIGINYKRGKFFYWQAGLKYTYAQYKLKTSSSVEDNLGVSSFEVPLTAGVNFLAFVNRLVALRLFVSGVPSFTMDVKENSLGINKDNVNSFIFYGQGGLGINVAFFVIETGYNYGFQDLLKNNIDSKPGQFFVNVGFRF